MTTRPHRVLRCGPVLLGCAALLLAASSADRPLSANELKLKTERVIVFKDGYAMIIKRATGTTNENGELYTNQVPDSAVLGSFWATPREGRIVTMTAGWVEAEKTERKETACRDTMEVLRANLGKACSLQLSDKSILSGKIVRVLTQKTTIPLTEAQRIALGLPVRTAFRPSLSSSRQPALPITQTISGVVGNQFVLKTQDGDVLVPASSIQRLTIPQMTTTTQHTVTTKQRTKRLTFRFEAAGQKREMLIVYFRPGIRWIPTYRINLTKKDGKKMAEISMQAEILNEAEDLLDMPLDIVVGVPNFRFRTNVSPLVLEATLQNALVRAAPNLMGQFRNSMSNSLYSQRSSEVRRRAAQANAAAGAGTVQLPNELTATGAQDLFVYNLPKLRLRKGERAAVPIMSTTVPYRDVYTWNLHVRRHDIATAPSGSGIRSPLTLSQNKVWRQIELTNNTKLPWTTGAAMIMQGRQPLAQELLTYTSPQDHCRVPVTVSIDTRGSVEETETKRTLQALRWSGYQYAKIHQRASLHLCNNKNETITVEISFRFGGKSDKVSHKGKTYLMPYEASDWHRYRGDPAVNNSTEVRWTVTLKPGETFEPTVDYHFFTRQ